MTQLGCVILFTIVTYIGFTISGLAQILNGVFSILLQLYTLYAADEFLFLYFLGIKHLFLAEYLMLQNHLVGIKVNYLSLTIITLFCKWSSV